MLQRAAREAGTCFLRWEVHVLAAGAGGAWWAETRLLQWAFLREAGTGPINPWYLGWIVEALIAALFGAAVVHLGITDRLPRWREPGPGAWWFLAAGLPVLLYRYLFQEIQWQSHRGVIPLLLEGSGAAAAVHLAARSLLLGRGRTVPPARGILVPGLPVCIGGALASLAAGPILSEAMRHAPRMEDVIPWLPASESSWLAWAWARYLVRAAPLLIYARWIALAAGADPGEEEGEAAAAEEPVRGPR